MERMKAVPSMPGKPMDSIPRTAEDVLSWFMHGTTRFLFNVRFYPNDGIRVPTKIRTYGYNPR